MSIDLKKKLAAVAIKKHHTVLAKWVKSITNHLYWVVSTTEHETELRRAKWLSILHHIGDVHEFEDPTATYTRCDHPSLSGQTDDCGRPIERQWIKHGMTSRISILCYLKNTNIYLTMILPFQKQIIVI